MSACNMYWYLKAGSQSWMLPCIWIHLICEAKSCTIYTAYSTENNHASVDTEINECPLIHMTKLSCHVVYPLMVVDFVMSNAMSLQVSSRGQLFLYTVYMWICDYWFMNLFHSHFILSIHSFISFRFTQRILNLLKVFSKKLFTCKYFS